MFNSIFKIVYFICFLLASIVRKSQTIKHGKNSEAKENKDIIDVFLLTFVSIGMFIPLIYVFTDKLDFANYYSPEWTAWTGTGIFLFSVYFPHAPILKVYQYN